MHYTDTNLPLRRNWFQFRLRTLLIVITLLSIPCAWIGYSLKWVQERHEVLSLPGTRIVSADDLTRVSLPIALQLVGEEGMAYLWVSKHDPITLDRARQLFPEAIVTYGPVPSDFGGP